MGGVVLLPPLQVLGGVDGDPETFVPKGEEHSLFRELRERRLLVIAAQSPASFASNSAAWPALQLTITRSTPARTNCDTWYSASGCPAIGTSAFGCPRAASPSLVACPPARMIASTSSLPSSRAPRS